ncbi:hypothetical protein [Thermosulfurimonas sp.]|uniref:hypothetical protein n=1 Tax=Thermosulfurimonas sp. TaxID=2080236 RepID=UPI0025F695B7|nr:hypothetical protein [Thermosulfurimonas sp.]
MFAVKGFVLAQLVTTAGLAVRLLKATLDEILSPYEEVARTSNLSGGSKNGEQAASGLEI